MTKKLLTIFILLILISIGIFLGYLKKNKNNILETQKRVVEIREKEDLFKKEEIQQIANRERKEDRTEIVDLKNGWNLYKNYTQGYEFEYPSDWFVEMNRAGTLYVADFENPISFHNQEVNKREKFVMRISCFDIELDSFLTVKSDQDVLSMKEGRSYLPIVEENFFTLEDGTKGYYEKEFIKKGELFYGKKWEDKTLTSIVYRYLKGKNHICRNKVSIKGDDTDYFLKKTEKIAKSFRFIEKDDDKEEADSKNKKTTLKKVKEEKEFVYYGGEIVLSGSYYYYKDGLFKDKLCFYVNEETGYLIPRDPDLYGLGIPDNRSPWFCFENHENANKMFGITSILKKQSNLDCVKGKATIRINNYIVNRLEAAVYDTAILEEIIDLNRDVECKL